jgi:hypothetical protein
VLIYDDARRNVAENVASMWRTTAVEEKAGTAERS